MSAHTMIQMMLTYEVGALRSDLYQLALRPAQRREHTAVDAAGVQVQRAIHPARSVNDVVAIDYRRRVLVEVEALGAGGAPVMAERSATRADALDLAVEAVAGDGVVPAANHVVAERPMRDDQASSVED